VNPLITAMVPSTGGVRVAVHDLGGSPDSPRLVLCHATGFHARIWEPVAAELSDRFHCYALDFRGHGYTETPAGIDFVWEGMIDDFLAVVDAIGGGPLVAAGWSMGGAAIIGAELRRPGTIEATFVFEPIMVPTESDRQTTPDANPLAEGARRRRAEFASHDEVYGRYASRPPFDRADPAALRSYVLHGFAETPESTVRLRCLPEVEAAVFEKWRTGLFDELSAVRCPVVVAASGDREGPALLAPEIAARLPEGHLERFDDLSHFGPLEEPDRIAAAISTAINEGESGSGH
jgi:pimeloyl-ACP methyl ester carboxylesterase